MSRSRQRITPAAQQAVVAYARAGCFPHVAAEAAGVAPDVFARLTADGGPARHRGFADAVRQAHAQARADAEIAIHGDRPLDWLKSGPGRPQPGQPGWTAPAKAADSRTTERSLLQDPFVQRLFAELLDAMASHPEARAAASEVVARQERAQAPS
jgi:hypothetical protein